jgi:hypothetical protein
MGFQITVFCIFTILTIKPTNTFYWAITPSCIQYASYMFRPAHFVILTLGARTDRSIVDSYWLLAYDVYLLLNDYECTQTHIKLQM